MRLVQSGALLLVGSAEEFRVFTQVEVSRILGAIEAGHLDALRHYAEHGALPPVAPVWPGLRVMTAPYGCWEVFDAENVRRANVTPHAEGYRCQLQRGTAPYGATPQAAVDAARTYLAERWGLST